MIWGLWIRTKLLKKWLNCGLLKTRRMARKQFKIVSIGGPAELQMTVLGA